MDSSSDKYIKKFDEWNKRKKILNERILQDSFFFLEREIWWTSTGVNIGNEIDGKNDNFERPILIIKKFDENNFIGIPISTKYHLDNAVHKMFYNKESRYILIKQLRHYSSNRLLRLIMRVDEVEFSLIRDKVMNLFI